MKLARLGLGNVVVPIAVMESGEKKDLRDVFEDINAEEIFGKDLKAVEDRLSSFPAAPAGASYLPPVAHCSKIVCVGPNYLGHADELNLSIPREPVIFLKAPSALTGAYDTIFIPPGAAKLDYEAELAIVIGKEAKNIREKEADDHILGYTILNDVAERDMQFDRGGTWTKGKSYDCFAPLGPWLVTKDELPKPDDLIIQTKVNGKTKQKASTSSMLFSVQEIVSYVSFFMTLLPGDVIATGTPPGVSLEKDGPYLWDSDVVEISIENLGNQCSMISLT